MKILVADRLPSTKLAELEEHGFDVVSDPELKDDALTEALAAHRPDVLVVRSTKVREAHLEAGSGLSLVIRAGAGVNTIDVAGASRRGIYVANTPGKNSVAVAELAFAHILSLDRFLVDAATDLRQGRWNKKRYGKATGIKGRTLGLIGLGGIGREMIPRATAFGMRVVAWSRSLTPERASALGVEAAASPLDVARVSDVLSVHVALNDDTRHLVGRSLIDALPDGALVINTSRGGVVDEAALVEAAQERGIRAGLDVFDGEPSGGEGTLDPGIFSLPQIQGTHHTGASTQQAQIAVADEVVHIIRSFAGDGSVPNCVNLAATTPASHLLVVRHEDRVGVLADVLATLRAADINVQEMENQIFAGGEAACARIQLSGAIDEDTLASIRGQQHVLAVTVTTLD